MALDLFQRMQVFCRIVDSGGIRAAAAKLRLSPAAVSQQLRGLEEHLGLRLLERSTRRLRLTENGADYLSHCQRILSEVADTEALLARSRTTPSGRLTVDVPTTIGRLLVEPHLQAFWQRYPDVRMELIYSSGLEVDPRDRFDVLVHIGELADSTLVARRIGVVRSVIVGSPGYLARHGEPTSIEDLASHRAIHYLSPRTQKVYDWAIQRDGKPIRVPVASAFAASEHQTRLFAAESGLGLAQMLSLDVADSVRSGRLRRVLAGLDMVGIPVQLLYHRSRHLSAKVRSFVDFMAERYPGDAELGADPADFPLRPAVSTSPAPC